MKLFINLQENSYNYNYESCIIRSIHWLGVFSTVVRACDTMRGNQEAAVKIMRNSEIM